MIPAGRVSTAQFGMYPLLVAFLGFIAPLCAAQGAAVIVSGGDQTSGSGQAYVVVGDNLASYSGQQTQQSLSGASYSGQTGYIRGQQYQVVSADDVYGSSNQGGSDSSNIQGLYVQSSSASQPATDVQLNEVPVQSLSVDLLPTGYQQQQQQQQQLSSSYGGALGSSSSSAVSDAPAQSVQSSNFAGLNLAAFGIEPASYLAGSGRDSTLSATQSTSKPAATYSAGTSSETNGGRRHGTAKRAGGRKRVQEEQDDDDEEEQDAENEEQDQEAVADEDQPETDLDGGDANLEDANYEVATRVSNSEAKSGYARRRRRRKVKPKVIIVKKVLPLSTTTYRG